MTEDFAFAESIMKRVYGSRKSAIVSEEDDDSPAKCRERRHRRIAMRRMAADASGSAVVVGENEGPKCVAPISITETTPPVYGMMSVVGRQREMEDSVSIKTNLCSPEINDFRPVHFFGVFDGHGGRHVSALCKEHMHVIMAEELMRVKVIGGESKEKLWTTAINRSFQRLDEMALILCLCDSNVCRCNPQLSFMGSTAVVSILTNEYIFMANCGDSRAVLCRNGRPVPLSGDHKPNREDEGARIEGCGGGTMLADGERVEGILSMSQAIGDRLLKQWVTSEPEISVTRREAGDECLIIGSDGLWDVLSSELTCKIVHDCLAENEHHQEPQIGADHEGATRSDSIAMLLVRLALGRRSTDNISVIVIDLRN